MEDDYISGRFEANENFAKSLIALYRAIALFYMKAACYFARSTPFRTVRGLVAADAWGPALESARTAETTCYSLVTLLGWTTSLRKVDEVLKNLSRIEFKDLIRDVEQWLVWDVKVEQQHQAKRPSLALGYDKAGSWLLGSAAFKSWEEETAGQFWITGAVGTGKSSLVALIVDHMRQRDNVAYFYCTNADTIGIPNTAENLENDAVVTRIFRGLLGRLAMSPDRRRVAEEIEAAFDQSSQPGALGRVPLTLSDAQDLLVRIINTRRDTTIIIDGLDELPDYGHLLRALKDIDDRVDAGRLRLLLASRGVVPVRDYFRSTNLVVTGEKSSMDDMHSFVSGRVQRFKEYYNQDCRPLSEVLDDIVKTLPKKAEGMSVRMFTCHLHGFSADDLFTSLTGSHWPAYASGRFLTTASRPPRLETTGSR